MTAALRGLCLGGEPGVDDQMIVLPALQETLKGGLVHSCRHLSQEIQRVSLVRHIGCALEMLVQSFHILFAPAFREEGKGLIAQRSATGTGGIGREILVFRQSLIGGFEVFAERSAN